MKKIPVLFLLLPLLLALTSCASADKLVENGNYDQAIALAKRKLTGKDRKNPKLVLAAEEAFAKVTTRDLREIERLKRNGGDESWGAINNIYRNIRKRQDAIAPLLPLTDKNGYTATFDFVAVDAAEKESRDRAAAYHYNEAQRLLAQARDYDDKSAARRAYRELEECRKYYRSYKDTEFLLNEAHHLGIINVLVGVHNNAPVVTPAAFERELSRIDVGQLNTFWEQYHTSAGNNIQYDYEMKLRITDIFVSPEQVRQREYVDTREIQDGFTYVLDDKGNVMKDTLGNDIKIPRMVNLQAFVIETQLHKQADVRGVLEVYNARNRQLLRSTPLAAATVFNHCAATFRGDERALSDQSRRNLRQALLPFPSSEALILQAAEELKPSLINGLNDCKALVRV